MSHDVVDTSTPYVSDWLKTNHFEILADPLHDILGIDSSCTLDELSFLSKDDINQFFNNLSKTNINIPLKTKVNFKRKLFTLLKNSNNNNNNNNDNNGSYSVNSNHIEGIPATRDAVYELVQPGTPGGGSNGHKPYVN